MRQNAVLYGNGRKPLGRMSKRWQTATSPFIRLYGQVIKLFETYKSLRLGTTGRKEGSKEEREREREREREIQSNYECIRSSKRQEFSVYHLS